MSKTYKDKANKKSKSIYAKNMLTRKIVLPFTSVGGNLSEILKQKLGNEFVLFETFAPAPSGASTYFLYRFDC